MSVSDDNFTDAGTQQDAYTLYRANRVNQTRRPNWFAFPFENSTADYGSGWQPCQYCIDLFGFVHLRGLMAGPGVGNPIGQLPAGFWPAASEMFTVAATYGGGFVIGLRLDISSTGVVEWGITQGVNWDGGFLSLSGVTYMAAAA